MFWKEELAILEQEGNFDIAIFLLEKVIKEHPDNVEAYIFLLYRLMDTIVEGACYWANVSRDPLKDLKEAYYHMKASEEYRSLLQTYFDESYAKFSDSPEYLFYTSGILVAQYWFCCMRLNDEFLDAMEKKAFSMGYNSILARAWEYQKLAQLDPHNSEVILYAHQIVTDPSLQEQLASKGAIANYVIGGYISWAKKILEEAQK